MRGRAEIPNFGKAFNAVLAGQLDIHKSNVVTEATKLSDRLFTCARNVHVTITHTQSNHQTFGKVRIVLDN